jgi:hypothetical protein
MLQLVGNARMALSKENSDCVLLIKPFINAAFISEFLAAVSCASSFLISLDSK